MKGQLVHSWIESIVLYCYGLFRSSSLMLLFNFERVLRSRVEVHFRWSIDLALPIDSSRLQMRSLRYSDACFGFLRLFRSHFRVNYDWNNRLHVPLRRPPPVPFPLLCVGTAVSLPSRRGGTERKSLFTPTVDLRTCTRILTWLSFAGTNVWHFCRLAQKHKILYPLNLGICTTEHQNVSTLYHVCVQIAKFSTSLTSIIRPSEPNKKCRSKYKYRVRHYSRVQCSHIVHYVRANS
jgi:hypothetical protein